ncbi:phlebovirus nonstructural domain protein [Ceratobasidium sp. AG-Ba]|nr:phlebovirus nonstructural domain protein [Ceratobasidium sp. AG-Ba]QRW11975.1 phlebovirus nonstructural domain protein [Ceratobasidium sp. AG-Ba]
MPADTFDMPPQPLQPPIELQPAMNYDYPPFSPPSAPPSAWDSPAASTSRPRGHSRHNSASSVAHTPVNNGRRGSTKDPEALQAALERTKSARKRRTNSTASAMPDDDPDDKDVLEDSASALRQRQEDARLIRCDAEQQRRNELGKGYDRLRAALNRGDERLSKSRVVERATARVVQLRDQNQRMQEELMRKQDMINELNRANEQLMLEASGAAPLLVSSPHSASSPSSGRPGSSSHTSVSAFGVGQTGHSHDRSSSLPTPPHTYTGLQYSGESNPEFGLPNHSTFKQDPFAYGPFEGTNDEQRFYPHVGAPASGEPEFFVPRDAPPGVGLNPLSLPGHPRPDSPRTYEHGQPAFGLPVAAGGDEQHWLPAEGVHQWNNATSSGLPGTFTQQPHSFTASPTREGGLNEMSEVPASGYPAW